MAENKDKKVLNVPNKRELTPNTFDTAEHKEVRLKRNVPNLRFKEFEGEWKECRLGEIMNFSEKRINASTLTTSNYISTENMLQDFQGVIEAKSVPNNTNVISFTYGDILISNIRPYLKKVWKASIDGGCSSDVLVMKANDKINNDYLHYVIANNQFINFVMNGAKGVKMPRGDKEQMKTYIVSLPPMVKEQNKIAKFLSLLDERIATQNKIIDKLESLIKGIRSKLYKDLIGKEIFLGDISDIYQPKTISSTELIDKGFPVYGANGIIGYYDQYNHEMEQICITCRGNTCGTINFSQQKSWITGNAMVVNTDNYKDIVDKRYLFHILVDYNFNNIISGSGQPQIVRTPLEKIKIKLPIIGKQKQIAKSLDSILQKIDLEKYSLSLLNLQKTYLLRQMFI